MVTSADGIQWRNQDFSNGGVRYLRPLLNPSVVHINTNHLSFHIDWKNGREFSSQGKVREKSRNFEYTGKVWTFFTKYWEKNSVIFSIELYISYSIEF